MNLDLSRWPLLLGAAVCFGFGFYALSQSGDKADGQFAAFTLLIVGATLLGAFIAVEGRRHHD